jgi:hypothetical protein
LLDDLMMHSPDKVWDPFYGEINQMANEHVRDFTKRALDSGVPVPVIKQQLQKRWGDVNTEVSRANMHKENFISANDQLNKNAAFYKPEAKQALNDIFFDGRNARRIHDINVNDIAPKVFDNPDLFDVNGVAVDFMKGLPEKVNQYYTEMFNPLGQQYNIQDTKTKLGFKTDDQGRLIMDPRTGLPKISMTDDVYIQAMQNPFLSKLVARDVPNGTVEKNKEYLTGILEGLDPKEAKSRIQLGFKKNEDDRRYYLFGKGGYGYRNTMADLEGRDELLDRVVSGKEGKDILSYFGNLANDIRAEYTNENDKKQKGRFIRMEYISNLPDGQTGVAKQKGYVYLPLNTEEERRQAKVALSQRMDEINKKSALGEEYPTYINEKRKSMEKTSPPKTLNATKLKKTKAAPLN